MSENPTVGNLATLRKDVTQFDEIDNLIKEIKKKMEPFKEQLKMLMAEKKKLQTDICSIMGSLEIESCNLPVVDGIEPKALKHSVVNSFVPMSQAQVKESLVNFFTSKDCLELDKLSPSDKALLVYNFIYNNRRKVTRDSLRKIKPVKVDVLEEVSVSVAGE